METFKAVRKSIMVVGSDDKCLINKEIIDELSEFPQKTDIEYPWDIITEQVLPTTNRIFDSRIWFLIFRSMLPVATNLITKQTVYILPILQEIYSDVILSTISEKYQDYIDDSNEEFKTKINKRGLVNAYNHKTRELRVKSYHNHIMEYKEFKNRTVDFYIDSLITISNQIQMTDLTSFQVQMLWMLFSLNTNIIPVEKYTIEQFNNDYPEYEMEKCKRKEWNKLKLVSFHNFVSNRRADGDLIMYDDKLIHKLQNLIVMGKYEPFSDSTRLKYNLLGMNVKNNERKIDGILFQLSEESYTETLLKLHDFKKPLVLKAIYSSLELTKKDKIVKLYVQLLRDLDVPYHQIIETRKDLSGIIYYIYDNVSLEDLFTFDDQINVIISIYKHKHINIKKYHIIKKQITSLANELIENVNDKKLKFGLMDIIENI